MSLDYRFSPDITELSSDEAEKLGTLTEHSAWPIFIKYLHIERWATINNGFIKAEDVLSVGYCQGDVGRINKIESDMKTYSEYSDVAKSVERSVSEHDKLEREFLIEYSDDEDLPLAP